MAGLLPRRWAHGHGARRRTHLEEETTGPQHPPGSVPSPHRSFWLTLETRLWSAGSPFRRSYPYAPELIPSVRALLIKSGFLFYLTHVTNSCLFSGSELRDRVREPGSCSGPHSGLCRAVAFLRGLSVLTCTLSSELSASRGLARSRCPLDRTLQSLGT